MSPHFEIEEGEFLVGMAGTATEINWKVPPPGTSNVATWFLECPGQSAGWMHYILGAIHLRKVPGIPEPTITIPHATHEVMLYALNPSLDPSADNPLSWGMLVPINFVEQVQLPNDEACKKLIRKCIDLVLVGRLWAEPPLAGQVEPWRTGLLQTAAHLRGEPHAC